MANLRRYYIPNAIVFITQVVQDRRPVFRQHQQVDLLRSVLDEVKRLHPFAMLGYVFLPDHFHMLVQPLRETTFSQIMHSLKPNFTKTYKEAQGISDHLKLWQRRFWDHVIRDETDLEQHLDYIHYNPVKHGLVSRPENWCHSSFLEWKQRGVYPDMWGWSEPDSLVGLNGGE
jgi:REP-associated tyrosine transposase